MTKNHPFPTNKKPRDLATTMNDVGADVVDTDEIIELGELESILNSVLKKTKPPEKVQMSLYLDPKVARAFNAFGKKNGKGAKSELINTFLKKVLQIED